LPCSVVNNSKGSCPGTGAGTVGWTDGDVWTDGAGLTLWQMWPQDLREPPEVEKNVSARQ